MKSKIKIAASLLAADFSDLAREVKMVERAGVDLLHLDIMDGHFVNNISFGPGVVNSLKAKTKLPFDTHLMIENPERYIREFARAGSRIITFHIETVGKAKELIESIRRLGCSPGIVLNPKTPVSRVRPFLKEVDLILVMTVNPGFGGQKFIPATLAKLRELKRTISKKKLKLDLEVDGGINGETAKMAVSAGANILVVGTYLFQSRGRIYPTQNNGRHKCRPYNNYKLKKRIKELRCRG